MESQNRNLIDVVYVLGTGSSWKNNEIRFSLRALSKNLKGYGKIWVVGEKPEWIQDVNHIPFKDELMNNADGNIARKVLRVCQEQDLSENFLFINDDHLILKPVEAIDIPPFHKGNMASFSNEYFETSFWRGRLWRTRNILLEKGFTAYHFDCHTPMVMNKTKFPWVMAQFNFEKNIGFTMKSLYGNLVYGDAAPKLNGEKVAIFRPMTIDQVRSHCRGRQFVAFNDKGLRPGFKHWLFENFPEPSIYESNSDIREPFMVILDWLQGEDKDFQTGCRLFEKYGKSRKAVKFLLRGQSTARKMKLEHLLRELLNYL
jgi:hypothetical protein